MSNGIRINLSDKEAASESREQEPIPSGKYLLAITDVELKECGLESKNPGKPYYAVEFTVQDGEYAGRKVFTNAMLFEGAAYTIVNMLKALDVKFSGSDFQVPEHDANIVPDAGWWLGKQFVVAVKKQAGKLKPDGSGDKYPDRAEPKGFWPSNTWKGAPAARAASAGSASILP